MTRASSWRRRMGALCVVATGDALSDDIRVPIVVRAWLHERGLALRQGQRLLRGAAWQEPDGLVGRRTIRLGEGLTRRYRGGGGGKADTWIQVLSHDVPWWVWGVASPGANCPEQCRPVLKKLAAKVTVGNYLVTYWQKICQSRHVRAIARPPVIPGRQWP